MKLVVAVLLSVLAMGEAIARDRSLDVWFDDTLIPAVTDKLATHPRFRGETLMFVVLDGSTPAAVSNELALDLRNRLLDAAVKTPGLRIVWQRHGAPTTGCESADAAYLIGIDVAIRVDQRVRVGVRMLDTRERAFVAGVRESWVGQFSARQRQAFSRTATDPAFLGSRDVPYRPDQGDLIAAHLSRNLHCEISRSLTGDYVVSLSDETPDDAPLGSTVDLATRNLDAKNSVVLTRDRTAVNAAIDARSHAIAGSLHQYWLTITPLTPDAELDSISTSVYVDLGPDPANPVVAERYEDAFEDPYPAPQAAAATHVTGVDMPGSRAALLDPLALYRAGHRDHCRFGPPCAVLRAKARRDAIVFALAHTPGGGLMRLTDTRCEQRGTGRVLVAGRSTLYIVPNPVPPLKSPRVETRWRIAPTDDTYYAIAVDNARDARRLSVIIDRLPSVCEGRPGPEALALQRWLEELSHVMLSLGDRATWRAIAANTATRSST